MRRRSLSAVAVLLAAGLILYTRGEESTLPAFSPTSAPATAPAGSGIAAPAGINTPAGGLDYWRDINFPTVRLSGMPLEEAIEKFRDATHANIVVDWTAIEAAGLHRTTPIRVRLYNVSALKALELILGEAREPGCLVRLESKADDEGVIHISTPGALDLGVTTIARMYDVRDLIARLYDPEGKESEAVFKDPAAVDLRSEMLMRLISETVDPDSWKDNGGALGSIRTFAAHLLITQSPEGHRKIEYVLYNLRRITTARARGEQPTTRGVDLLAPPTTEAGKK